MNTQIKRAKSQARLATAEQKAETLTKIATQMLSRYPARYGRMRLTSIDGKMSIQYDTNTAFVVE